MTSSTDEGITGDPTTAAWRALSPLERVLWGLCDEPGLRTDFGARARQVLRSLRREELGGTEPPRWWKRGAAP